MKKIFFISAIILVSSIAVFAQKNEPTPKPKPPVIVVPPKPAPTPKPEKPTVIAIDLFLVNNKK